MKILERIGIKLAKKRLIKTLPKLPDRVMDYIKEHDDEFVETVEEKLYEALLEMADKAAQVLDNPNKK